MATRHRAQGTDKLSDRHILVQSALTGSHQAQVNAGVYAEAEACRCPHFIVSHTQRPSAAAKRFCAGYITAVYAEDGWIATERPRFPVVNISNSMGRSGIAGNVLSDDEAVGRLAARHLLARGSTTFLAVGQVGRAYSGERLAGFAATVAQAGHPAEIVESTLDFPIERWGVSGFIDKLWKQFGTRLRRLDPDAGIFCVTDALAWPILRLIEQRLPDRLDTLSVLGVDNSEGGMFDPRRFTGLSSVQPGFREIGSRALRMVLRAEGRPAAILGLVERVEPERVVQRASTAGRACGDPATARALRLLWTAVREEREVSVAEIARRCGMNRRTLERRFSDLVGEPARSHLAGLRIQYARQLLEETEDPVSVIAHRCGYAEPSSFSNAFRDRVGTSPRDYRAGGGR